MKKFFQQISGLFTFSFGLGFGAIWIGLWSLGTLGFDVAMARSTYLQLRALSFPTADGTVTGSRVEVENDSEGATYLAKIDYRYTVARQVFHGSRLQYQWSSFGPGEARRSVAQYPQGSVVRVYYNPRDPADSLLRPGLDSGHALIALFMTPFNIIMLGCWLAVWEYSRGTEGRLPWGVKASSGPDALTLHIYPLSPLITAAGAVLTISFLGVFAAAFGSFAMPQVWLVALAWSAVVVGAIWAYRWQLSQARVLSIDEFRGCLTLRGSQYEALPEPTPLKELQAIELHKTTTRDSDGDEKHTWALELVRKKPDGKNLRLASEWTELQALSFGQWLSDRLRLRLTTCSRLTRPLGQAQ